MNCDLRNKSTSGGIFIQLSKRVIELGGVVFGVYINEEQEICHMKASTFSDLNKMVGSKYVQSNKKNIFLQVKQVLDAGKITLFSGTPCEVLGLKKFLKREYTNLILVDLLCHGAPSPKVWRRYLKENGFSKPDNINFRSKITGWFKSSIRIIEGSKIYSVIGEQDPYISLFNNGYTMRPSCFECRIKSIKEKKSDITLGDFWGVQTIRPFLFDNKGISLIFCNTSKGYEMVNKISNNLYLEEIEIEEILYENGDIGKPMKRPHNREQFFQEFNRGIPLKKLKEKYIKKSIKKIIILKIKNMLKKIGIFDCLKKIYRQIKNKCK